jgi:hypothetical protein
MSPKSTTLRLLLGVVGAAGLGEGGDWPVAAAKRGTATGRRWWRDSDSNRGPPAYEAGELTELLYRARTARRPR